MKNNLDTLPANYNISSSFSDTYSYAASNPKITAQELEAKIIAGLGDKAIKVSTTDIEKYNKKLADEKQKLISATNVFTTQMLSGGTFYDVYFDNGIDKSIDAITFNPNGSVAVEGSSSVTDATWKISNGALVVKGTDTDGPFTSTFTITSKHDSYIATKYSDVSGGSGEDYLFLDKAAAEAITVADIVKPTEVKTPVPTPSVSDLPDLSAYDAIVIYKNISVDGANAIVDGLKS